MQDQFHLRALPWAVGIALGVASLVVATHGMVVSSHNEAARACAATSCSSTTSVAAKQEVASTTSPSTAARSTSTTAAAPPKKHVTSSATKWDTPLPATHLAAPIVAATSAGGNQLLMVGSDGGVFPVGRAGFYGSVAGHPLTAPITAAAADAASGGYWLAGADGGVFAFHAPYLRGVNAHRLSAPIAAIAGTPGGKGYWLVGSDGGVFAFGNAIYYGSLSATRLSTPIVAMAATPDGKGYWLVGADGGVFAFGNAIYYGSLSATHLSTPIVAMAVTPDGKGYWLLGGDGGVFRFGDAPFLGSANGSGSAVAVRALVPTASGRGYWVIGKIGSVFSFGDAPRVADTGSPARSGSSASGIPSIPSVSMASVSRRTIVHSSVVNYNAGTSGYDLSQYQCSQVPPTRQEVAVVQVTAGYLDSAPNPCYVQEARWAGPKMSAYIYMDGLPSPTPASALEGPRGNCSATDIPCQSYNYGWNWTRYWVAYSNSLGVDPKLWWLDVERYSGWNGTLSNDLVITGALDALRSDHLATGIYSSSDQWAEIAGNLPLPGYPLWVPGAGNRTGAGYTASSFCSSGEYAFAGGQVKIVQFGYQGPFPGSYSGPAVPFDRDYAC